MQQFLTALGRKVAVINLDFASEQLKDEAAVDVRDLVDMEQVMQQMDLGPNGATLYCMEYLEANLDWLDEKLRALRGHYLVFDFPVRLGTRYRIAWYAFFKGRPQSRSHSHCACNLPRAQGQVELFTHHHSVRNIAARLVKQQFRLCAVHLVDSQHCADLGKFVSVLLLSLTTMLKLELPAINVLSKVDLLGDCDQLAFSIEAFTEAQVRMCLLGLLEYYIHSVLSDGWLRSLSSDLRIFEINVVVFACPMAGSRAFLRRTRRCHGREIWKVRRSQPCHGRAGGGFQYGRLHLFGGRGQSANDGSPPPG